MQTRRLGRNGPRFQGDNFARNLALVEQVGALADGKACSPGLLALAWVLAQDPHIVPIPGTRRRSHLEQNIAAVNVELGVEDLARLEATFPLDAAAGGRYPAAMMGSVNR